MFAPPPALTGLRVLKGARPGGFGVRRDDSEETKISALTTCYSGVLIDPRSLRGTSDRLPEPERLLFKT